VVLESGSLSIGNFLMRAARAIFFAVWSTWLFSQPALAEKRVALVMGNSAYQNVVRLANPTNDSEAMSAVLKGAGFDVVELKRDLGVSQMRRALRDFSDNARDADMAIVYFAGHGIEINGTNYLIPVDALLERDLDAFDEAIPLDRILTVVEPARQLRLVILDACRDNPFSKTMKRTIGTRAVGRGLAKVDPENPNTLIAFAAKAGSTALDGESKNSPFTAALVKYLPRPGLDLRKAFGYARDEVLKATNNKQEPFIYGSLGGDDVALVPPAAKPAHPEAEARIDYELAAQIGTKDAWDAFLASHPEGLYAQLARAQNSKLAAARQSRSKADDARREAEEHAAQKAEELRKQLEEQSRRQAAEAKQKLSEQAKRELEEARRQGAEQAERELNEARKQAELAQQQAEAARQQVEEAKRQAIAEARLQVEQAKRAAREESEKMASLAPNQAAPEVPPASPRIDQADITRLLQAHLKRVGCNSGNVDGKWDASSRKALNLFNKNAHTEFDIKLASLDALDAVRDKPNRVCPLICANGQRVEGDRCIEISCGSGSFLNSSGSCEKRLEPRPKARTATKDPAPQKKPAPLGNPVSGALDATGHRGASCCGNPAKW
jgi:uncharacterized caspase-like protein